MSNFKCEWCSTEKPQEDLYSWTGWEMFSGPICKECVEFYKVSNYYLKEEV